MRTPKPTLPLFTADQMPRTKREIAEEIETLASRIPIAVEEAPKLRVVARVDAPESDVIVEEMDDGRYEVSLLRDHGTTVARVVYTARQLDQLIKRALGALDLSKLRGVR